MSEEVHECILLYLAFEVRRGMSSSSCGGRMRYKSASCYFTMYTSLAPAFAFEALFAS
jgi:hypothetical protein